jgi:hypothetical protein
MTARREVISQEQAARLIKVAREAGGGSDWALLHIMLALIAFIGRESEEMRTSTALELVRLAMRLDPHVESVRWN